MLHGGPRGAKIHSDFAGLRTYEGYALALDFKNGVYRNSIGLAKDLMGQRGPELVTNGGFDVDANWTKGTGWTISGGKANFTPGTSGHLIQGISITPGHTYELTYTVSNYGGSGAIQPAIGGAVLTSRASNGAFTEQIVAGSSTANIDFYGGSTFSGSIDNISVREVAATYTRSGAKSELGVNPVAYGSELVSPLDFQDGSWTLGGSPTILGPNSFSTASSVGEGPRKDILVVGQTYRLTINYTKTAGAFQVSNSSSSATPLFTANGGAATESQDVTFTATATTMYFRLGTASESVTINSISVKAVIDGPIISYPANTPGTVPGVGYWSRASVTNLLLQSQTFDNASWAKNRASVSANSIAAPDGAATADTLVEDATNGQHTVTQTATTVAATAYTLVGFFKAKERSTAILVLDTTFRANFDLSTGTVASTQGSPTSTSITNCGNGWYRCAITATVSGTATPCVASMCNTTTGFGYQGDGTSGIYLWQAQLVAGSDPGPIIVTTGAAATVGADDLHLASPITADQDFIMWVVANFKVAGEDARLLTLTDGTNNNRILIYRPAANTVGGFVMAAGTSQDVGTAPALQAPTGRTVVLLRRRGGKFMAAGKNSSGVVALGGEGAASSFPIITSAYLGQNLGTLQPDSPIEFVGIKLGTFSDADLTALLQAA